jgi:hypothetical protein
MGLAIHSANASNPPLSDRNSRPDSEAFEKLTNSHYLRTSLRFCPARQAMYATDTVSVPHTAAYCRWPSGMTEKCTSWLASLAKGKVDCAGMTSTSSSERVSGCCCAVSRRTTWIRGVVSGRPQWAACGQEQGCVVWSAGGCAQQCRARRRRLVALPWL